MNDDVPEISFSTGETCLRLAFRVDEAAWFVDDESFLPD
jgi:hypothetical protein